MNYMRQVIVGIVYGAKVVKDRDLELKVMSYMGPAAFKDSEYRESIEGLIAEKEIMEVKVSVNIYDFSIYVPQGTMMRFSND